MRNARQAGANSARATGANPGRDCPRQNAADRSGFSLRRAYKSAMTQKTTMARKTSSGKPLTGRVALVAGATRGAGRGIARALAEAGATVYCTGRSVPGKPSPYGRPETINETATLIKAAGGAAIAVRVDHTNERQVSALFRRILRAHHRLDIVVDSVAGEDPLLKQYGYLWQAELKDTNAQFRQRLTSRS